MPLSDEQHAWLVSTLKINVKHAEVETGDGGEHGFKPRARGAEYEGEESQVGAWRSTNKRDDESQEAYERRIASGHFVTRTLNEEERAETRTSTDDHGRLRDDEGYLVAGKKMYTMDARTGELNVGDEGYGIRDLDAEGNPDGDLRGGFSGIKQDSRAAARSGGQQRVEATHHSTLADGGEVASAGFIETEDGKVRKITNSSGHYKPRFEHLLQAVEHLMKTGAMLDTEIVDHEGNSVEDSNPKAFAVYTKVQTLIKSLDADKKSIEAALAGLTEEAIGEDEAAALDRKIKTHAARTETAQKALAALRKMGIGPRNAMTGEVELTYAGGDVSGHTFRSAETERMQAHELLMGTGAGNLVSSEDDEIDADLISYTTTEGYPAGDGTSYPDQGPSGAQFYTSTEVPPPDGLYETVDPAAMGDPAPEPAKPWRDFDAKEDMLNEFKELASDRNLRPEDQGEAGKAAISEGQAPSLDEDAWNREIDDLADALAEIETEIAPPTREAAAAQTVDSGYYDDPGLILDHATEENNAAGHGLAPDPRDAANAQGGGYGNVPGGDAPSNGGDYGNALPAEDGGYVDESDDGNEEHDRR